MASQIGQSNSLLKDAASRNLQSICGQPAMPEQESDLLAFWDVGCRLFFNRIEYFILKTPSAEVPQRKAKLQTFATTNVIKKKIKQLDREKKYCCKMYSQSICMEWQIWL